MSMSEFFRYLLGHETSTGLAVQLIEVCASSTAAQPAEHSRNALAASSR